MEPKFDTAEELAEFIEWANGRNEAEHKPMSDVKEMYKKYRADKRGDTNES